MAIPISTISNQPFCLKHIICQRDTGETAFSSQSHQVNSENLKYCGKSLRSCSFCRLTLPMVSSIAHLLPPQCCGAQLLVLLLAHLVVIRYRP